MNKPPEPGPGASVMRRQPATGRNTAVRRLAARLLADESAVTTMECVVAGTALGVVAVAAYRLLAIVLASLAYRAYLIATLLTS